MEKETRTYNINIFPWSGRCGDSGYRPNTTAAVTFEEDGLSVKMETDEANALAIEEGYSGLVYTDSCMEFFLMPDPAHSNLYFNWEFNPRGAMYLTLGSHRFDRKNIIPENYEELFQVRTQRSEKGWSVEYRIPLEFLRDYFPEMTLKKGHRMRGNFYKCGDHTALPHFGCFAPIDLPEPDFHCPDFFADIIV